MSIEEAEKLVDETVAKLGEHFEAVHIVASWCENNTTLMCSRGTGNFYARVGMARAFIKRDEHNELASDIASNLKD